MAMTNKILNSFACKYRVILHIFGQTFVMLLSNRII